MPTISLKQLLRNQRRTTTSVFQRKHNVHFCHMLGPAMLENSKTLWNGGVALCRGNLIEPEDLPRQIHHHVNEDFLSAAVSRRLTMAGLEKEYILAVFKRRSRHKTRSAQRLGLDRKTLYRKLDEYNKAN